MMAEPYTIKDLNQLRLLTDPLKLKLLRAFAEGEKTTKQVAGELGESTTKLYRHVDALQDAGLLRVVKKTRKRGTVERTFQAVARPFEADRSLFADETGGDGADAFRNVLRTTEDEIYEALSSAGTKEEQDEFVMARVRCKCSPDRIAALRASLAEWIESAQEEEDGPVDEAVEFGALVAFYPIDDRT